MKIGIDGGGTKTELILIEPSGAIVARHLAPGCNPSVIGPDNARDILLNALLSLVSSAGIAPGTPRLSRTEMDAVDISHTLLCMAGSPGFWREIAATLTGYGQVEAMTDALPVLELATNGGPGLVLHAGTGSFVALRTADGSFHYVGGLGWRIGDPGSAQDIGRRAIARALAELQGWAAPSPLSQALSEAFQNTEPSAITAALHRDEEPTRRIGAFAARASQLATEGDTTAREIVLASTGELLACAETAARALFGAQNLNTLAAGLSGSILTQPFVMNALQASATLSLKALTESPIEGVRRLLLRQS